MADLNLRQSHSSGVRIWHALNGLAISGLLGTVVLRNTFLSVRDNAALMEAKAREAALPMSTEVARGMAKAIRTPMWDWHYRLGFCLIGLLILRFVLAFRSRKFPCMEVWAGYRAARSSTGNERRELFHFTAVKGLYLLFYATVLIMGLTGLLMYFSKNLSLVRETREVFQEVHEALLWAIAGFAGMHIVGVLVGEFTRYRGIVSEMISGRDSP